MKRRSDQEADQQIIAPLISEAEKKAADRLKKQEEERAIIAACYPDASDTAEQERLEDAFLAYQLHSQGWAYRDIARAFMKTKGTPVSLDKIILLIETEADRRKERFAARRDDLLQKQIATLEQVIRRNFEFLLGTNTNISGNNPSTAIIQASIAISRMTGAHAPARIVGEIDIHNSEVNTENLFTGMGKELASKILEELAIRKLSRESPITIEHEPPALPAGD